jgi:hypothetical protein
VKITGPRPESYSSGMLPVKPAALSLIEIPRPLQQGIG